MVCIKKQKTNQSVCKNASAFKLKILSLPTDLDLDKQCHTESMKILQHKFALIVCQNIFTEQKDYLADD